MWGCAVGIERLDWVVQNQLFLALSFGVASTKIFISLWAQKVMRYKSIRIMEKVSIGVEISKIKNVRKFSKKNLLSDAL